MADPNAYPVTRHRWYDLPERSDEEVHGEGYYKRKLKKAGIHVKRVFIFGGFGYSETYLLPYCWSSHGFPEVFSDGKVYKNYYSIYQRYLLEVMKECKGGME